MRTIVLIGCVKSVQEGEGVKKVEKSAYVLNGCSLTAELRTTKRRKAHPCERADAARVGFGGLPVRSWNACGRRPVDANTKHVEGAS